MAASARAVAHRINEMTALPNPPSPPLAVDAVTMSQYVVSFTWKDQSDDETGFVIEQETHVDDYYIFIPVPANTEQALVGLGGPGTFRIRAWNAGGVSTRSNEVVMHAPPRKRTGPTK
jgi:hypothetical protein